MSQQGGQRAGRYQRTTGGLIGALVVTLLAITAFVAFRAVNREQVEIRPEAVDYLSAVSALQGEGYDLVYPPRLPGGWIATSIDSAPGRDFEWAIGMLTDGGEFAGLRQSGASVEDLVEEYVDAGAREGEPTTLAGSVAGTWRTFSDAGGDSALAAELTGRLDGQTVLVFGSASAEELQQLAESLTTEPR